MPPWSADAPIGTFKNDPRLAQQEIDTIVAWVDGGAMRGNDRDMPKAPTFADGWTIGKPDAIFTMTEDFKVPAGTAGGGAPGGGAAAGGGAPDAAALNAEADRRAKEAAEKAAEAKRLAALKAEEERRAKEAVR